jgi:general secretion pathway protein D
MMRRRSAAWGTALLLSICCALLVCSAGKLPAWADPGPAETEITMNFQNVDIPVLAKFISEITGKNFLVDESVRGKVTIISPSKVTPDQAYQIFQSVLQLKGFTTQIAGKVIKIIPSRDVRQSAQLTESQAPFEQRGDEYVTRLVKLRNVDATSMISVLQPMISHDGLVAAFPDDNTVIITDDAYNVERLLKIVGSLDVEGQRRNVELIPLQYAFADEVAPEIDQLLGGGSSSGPGGQAGRPMQGIVAPSAQAPMGQFKVLADERTNSIIAAGGPLQMKSIRELVTKLDVRSPDAMQRIHVYRLKNADVTEMVAVLGGLIGGGGGVGSLSPTTGKGSLGRGSGGGGAMNSGFGGGSSLGGSGFGGGVGGGGFGGGFGGSGIGGGSFSGGGISGGSMMGGSGFGGAGSGGIGGRGAGGIGGGGAPGGGGERVSDFTNRVTLAADPATNALVISAAPQDWETLRNIIAELDVPRIQVFVQAIIVEMSAERQRQLGVDLQAATGISNSVIGLGSVNFGNIQTALGNPLGLTGLGLGLASGSSCIIPAAASAVTAATTGTTMTVPCDVALITALESDTHSNVLSAPTLLTADNEEAEIVVGENLPFVGSAASNAGLPGQIFNSVNRQNVGITLDIVPQVSDGDYVRLDLYEEVSNVIAATANNVNGPTTTIRSASTTVLVQNHRTAVIGGLMSNNDSISRQGVPWISDIPVLGNLFSDTSTDKQKDNLLVFLTPHVVRNKSQLRSLALDQRARFADTLGRHEMHDMPSTTIHSLYAPTFSVAVPPAADLNLQNNGSGGINAPAPAVAPEGDKATPFNTEEIPAPTSSSGAPAVAPLAANPTASSAPKTSTTAGSAIAALSTAAATSPMDPPAPNPKAP